MVVEPNIMATQQVRIEEQPIYGRKQWIFAPSWAEKNFFWLEFERTAISQDVFEQVSA